MFVVKLRQDLQRRTDLGKKGETADLTSSSRFVCLVVTASRRPVRGHFGVGVMQEVLDEKLNRLVLKGRVYTFRKVGNRRKTEET